MTEESRFAQAIGLIDAVNAQDPNRETWEGDSHPKELLYAWRMSETLAHFAPDASELVQLAARAQHIRRWALSRDAYPMDRTGYLRWRTELKARHAQDAGCILAQCGYDAGEIERVGALITKKRLKTDADAQLLEDVVCLVFFAVLL